MKKYRLLIIILLVFHMGACSHVNELNHEKTASLEPYASLVYFYSNYLDHLSAVRRGQCPMYPSCSEYSRQAVEKHGFLMGWTMSMDRLMRCGRDELKTAPLVFIDGGWKYYDPLENNENLYARP